MVLTEGAKGRGAGVIGWASTGQGSFLQEI